VIHKEPSKGKIPYLQTVKHILHGHLHLELRHSLTRVGKPEH